MVMCKYCETNEVISGEEELLDVCDNCLDLILYDNAWDGVVNLQDEI